NYACVLQKDGPHDVADLKRSYQYILGKVTAALKRCAINAAYLPISDIALVDNRKKISGNAQKRGRKYILHHGTLLYNYDLSRIEHYLAIPASMPDYRERRPHRDFVTNAPVSKKHFQDALCAEFAAFQEDNAVSAAERERLEVLRSSGNAAVIV
ncbi:MAG: hypothetical protein K8I00_02605, partial [Candidatus Omnitrophica bacterium]|nr:hypothetical protein [Candidatus Omnitrophota bacterium]